jgi:hypothetical protein
MIRAEMVRRSVSYDALIGRLERLGVTGYTERTLRNRVGRGHFSAAFLVQCMVAMGVTSIPLDEKLYPSSVRFSASASAREHEEVDVEDC